MFFYADNMMKFAFSEEFDDEEYESTYSLMGIAFDSTTSYRPGARNGPKAVREASYNFEQYNLRFDTSLTTTSYDIGDIQVVPGNYIETDMMIYDTVNELLDKNLTPITIGGEHTVTCSILRALHDYDPESFKDLTVVHLDAHFDMRDEYLGEKYSHASVLRRVHELNPKEIIQIGIRSAEYEEHEYVKEHDDITYFSSFELQRDSTGLFDKLNNIDSPVYITVDIDVLDPAYAPSVGTPAPCGLTPMMLEDIICSLASKDVRGLDVVEVASDTIGDSTSINAAKVIYDFLSLQN
ncbi:MAG: agmatinase [Methanosphaera sp. SHI613]|jgi:agmatinase|nr:MAG: agmatinase [Methanosphaera sp. SHI613]